MSTPTVAGDAPDARRPRRPSLAELGWLAPDAALVRRAGNPRFAKGRFDNFVAVPGELEEFLATSGYQISDDRSILFAASLGVPMHADDDWSVLWTQETPNRSYAVQFIVGGADVFLYPGQVLLFNARVRHGVIAAAPGRWSVFSANVRPLAKKSEA
ncbi:hypothetical protein F6X40_34515 [Paraburkholderia sp. UCT31]|uniref:hypothetical protein n=1 Tax=Paraburkholderia sp. UCT31 TaxID=2615209 RepID=UPI001655DB5D|nr:hypothetical protein [Paraburkholderia sp. UCT31]MBC8741677.1 hypothetical protein [Paraburkholderia sp. UCT31]